MCASDDGDFRQHYALLAAWPTTSVFTSLKIACDFPGIGVDNRRQHKLALFVRQNPGQ
jgi:hypothetical protein